MSSKDRVFILSIIFLVIANMYLIVGDAFMFMLYMISYIVFSIASIEWRR